MRAETRLQGAKLAFITVGTYGGAFFSFFNAWAAFPTRFKALTRGAGYVVGGDVGPHDLEHGALDVLVRDALDVAITHLLVPDLALV